MRYDIWVVNKKNRAGNEGEEFEATGLFINKGYRIGYRTNANELIYDEPVIKWKVSETGTILVETKNNQYMIKQLHDDGDLH